MLKCEYVGKQLKHSFNTHIPSAVSTHTHTLQVKLFNNNVSKKQGKLDASVLQQYKDVLTLVTQLQTDLDTSSKNFMKEQKAKDQTSYGNSGQATQQGIVFLNIIKILNTYWIFFCFFLLLRTMCVLKLHLECVR